MKKTLFPLCFLAALLPIQVAAQNLRPSDVDALPSSEPSYIGSYGADPRQIGELRIPEGNGPFPVVVMIHGGCWTEGYATMRNTAPVSSALTAKGVATWNIEYRQVGETGAGWPGTFLDWGMATDHLRVLAKDHPLDLTNITVVGHSAGAHAALFVGSRPRLSDHSEIRGNDPLQVNSIVAIDGPADLRSFVQIDEEICGKPVIAPLLGGTIEDQAKRYEEASPITHLPLRARQALISSSEVLAPEVAEEYRAAAALAGDKVDVRVFAESGHFEVIAPGTREWASIEEIILSLAGIDRERAN